MWRISVPRTGRANTGPAVPAGWGPGNPAGNPTVAPPAAVAVAGRAVGGARAPRVRKRNARLELGELLAGRVEAHRAARRRGPDHALAVDIDGDRAAHRRHVLRRLVDGDLLARDLELAER